MAGSGAGKGRQRGRVRAYREASGRGPGAVAGGTDDAGLVDVAGADEAVRSQAVSIKCDIEQSG